MGHWLSEVLRRPKDNSDCWCLLKILQPSNHPHTRGRCITERHWCNTAARQQAHCFSGSKTLTECQSRYSNIKREMLAIVYGMQRYHTYLYGKSLIVVTDHKPLVTICTKPLHAAPPRLQWMLINTQGYNYRIVYRLGNQMILADTLSRLPNPEN